MLDGLRGFWRGLLKLRRLPNAAPSHSHEEIVERAKLKYLAEVAKADLLFPGPGMPRLDEVTLALCCSPETASHLRDGALFGYGPGTRILRPGDVIPISSLDDIEPLIERLKLIPAQHNTEAAAPTCRRPYRLEAIQRHLSEGRNQRDIAWILDISPSTVHYYVKRFGIKP